MFIIDWFGFLLIVFIYFLFFTFTFRMGRRSGKRLRRLCRPGWENEYIDYKALKQVIFHMSPPTLLCCCGSFVRCVAIFHTFFCADAEKIFDVSPPIARR
jgi:hypothetical protein